MISALSLSTANQFLCHTTCFFFSEKTRFHSVLFSPTCCLSESVFRTAAILNQDVWNVLVVLQPCSKKWRRSPPAGSRTAAGPSPAAAPSPTARRSRRRSMTQRSVLALSPSCSSSHEHQAVLCVRDNSTASLQFLIARTVLIWQ